MTINYLAFAKYWRNSLADAEFEQGAFIRSEAEKFTIWTEKAINAGKLDQSEVDKFFSNEREDVDYVEVVLRPQVYLRSVQHNKERNAGSLNVVTPLITRAKLSRSGYLFPTPTTFIPRDLLEPLPKGVFAIGEIESLDLYKTLHTSVSIKADEIETGDEKDAEKRQAVFLRQWQKYLASNQKLLDAVAGEWVNHSEPYLKATHGYILKKDQPNGASRHILDLYDHLFISKKNVPLFSRFAALEKQPLKPLLENGAKFTERLGHSNHKFPLAKAQRDALSHLLTGKHGDILAVNGPPGTGKTTLVLSVVATLWARAALAKGEPPVVLAISSNNQAVTNVIEAFGKDFARGEGVMAGRWLPDIQSFGTYFSSAKIRAEASKKYQTEEFFENVETKEYLEAAKAFYLTKAKEAFPDLEHYTPESVTEILHKQLQKSAKELEDIQRAWQSLCHIRTQRAAIADDFEVYVSHELSTLNKQQAKLIKIKEAEQKWHGFLGDESVMYSLLGWLPAMKRKRRSRIIAKMNPILELALPDFRQLEPEQIESCLRQAMNDVEQAIKAHQRHLKQAEAIAAQKKLTLSHWHSLGERLGADRGQELTFEHADELADTAIRYPAFQLTTHYWEGRWLMDMLNIPDLGKEKKKKGRKTMISRWRRQMKLTPCVVSTCFMLPDKMKVAEYKGQQCFEEDYLYDFADLLIVDEAGQVLPEVAAACFALAKQALVIGDTAQIPPIWNITPTIDMGNMLSEKLLTGENQETLHREYEAISRLGKSAASGSVMKIAQLASGYQYDSQLARGMYLYEHRRCYDNIISFCNDLCYQGKLLPRRGVEKDKLFPAMGYLHIDGKGVKENGGSRYNLLEAENVAAWIAEHRRAIEERYNKPIHKVVGVVTPFGAQVSSIKRALRSHKLQTEEGSKTAITVGTVHALQGAERPIVIFSSVYSKHEDGSFIDSDSSMLNVAVSRAKDSFLVFGDMDLFEAQKTQASPRGLLARYLFAHKKNELHFSLRERSGLKGKAGMQILDGAEEHDAFLLRTLKQAKESLTIVSPWLIWKRLEQTGFLTAMTDACGRGVDIHVVTDKDFNKNDKSKEDLHASLRQLRERGIKTKLVNRVHGKLVMSDDALLCVGSYNWLSASRDERFAKYEVSMVQFGNNLTNEINNIRGNLEQRLV